MNVHRSRSCCVPLLVAGLAMISAGCMGDAVKQVQQAALQTRSAAKRAEAGQLLRNLGMSYHMHHDTHGRGPSGWDELKAAAAQSGGSPQAYDQLRDMGYTVVWGCRMRDITIGTSNFVAAYPSDAATNGGLVMLLDGSVRTMSAQEFQEAMSNQASVMPRPDSGAGAANPPAPPPSFPGNMPPGTFTAPGAGGPPPAFPGNSPGVGPPAGDAQFVPNPPAGQIVNQSGPGVGPVEAGTPLAKGDKLLAHWGNRWLDVTVLDVLADGNVQVHWEGWSDAFDEPLPRGRLRLKVAATSPGANPNPFAADPSDVPQRQETWRQWTDSTGQFQTEALLVSHDSQQVTLRKRDGKELTIPLDKLSPTDRIFVRNLAP